MDLGATISRAIKITWEHKVLWLLGFSLNVGGGLIHLLLVVAVVVLVFNLITRRRFA